MVFGVCKLTRVSACDKHSKYDLRKIIFTVPCRVKNRFRTAERGHCVFRCLFLESDRSNFEIIPEILSGAHSSRYQLVLDGENSQAYAIQPYGCRFGKFEVRFGRLSGLFDSINGHIRRAQEPYAHYDTVASPRTATVSVVVDTNETTCF